MQRLVIYLIAVVFGMMSLAGQAKSEVTSKKSKQAAQTEALPEPPTPAQQVKEAGLAQCFDTMAGMSRVALTHKYDVQSGWNRAEPAAHVFQSVAIISSPQKNAPDGLAALIASPIANGGCDGVAMQVVPLAADCPAVQTMMEGKGSKAIPMQNTKVLFDPAGKRIFLLEGFNKTCIAIAVDSTFGNASAPASGQ